MSVSGGEPLLYAPLGASRLEALRATQVPFGFIFTLTFHNVHELDWVAPFAVRPARHRDQRDRVAARVRLPTRVAVGQYPSFLDLCRLVYDRILRNEDELP